MTVWTSGGLLLFLHLLILIVNGITIIDTTKSRVIFPNDSPNLRFYPKDEDGNLSDECFAVKFENLTELDPTNPNRPQPYFSFNLRNISFVQEIFNVYSFEYYEGAKIHNVNYTIPGLAKIIFFIYEEDGTIGVDGTTAAKAGSVKFSMFLFGWPFASPNNTLSLYATITAENEKRNHVNLDKCKNSENSTTLSTTITCETSQMQGEVQLFEYAKNISLFAPIAPTTKSVKVHTGFPKKLVSKKSPCTGEPEKKVFSTVAQIDIRLEFDNFENSLLYDPELSVLFSGAGSNGGGGECDSSNEIEDDYILWMSLSFFIFAVIIVILVVGLSHLPCLRKVYRGPEGSRVTHLRRLSSQCLSNIPVQSKISQFVLDNDPDEEVTIL